ncbi:MAG: hypothetical protein KDA61_19090 [Planctomycetales bacterium]|nr:hypothetical protein [Planctomycetales bacterium]
MKGPRFSLRVLLLVVVVAAFVFAVYGRAWRRTREIDDVIQAWIDLGADVSVRNDCAKETLPFHENGPILVLLEGPIPPEQRGKLSALLRRTSELPHGFLSGLYISFVPISVADAASLSEIKGLDWLTLFDAGLTDDHLAKLAAAESLESLDVGQNEIGDEGVAALHALKKLRYLSIEANPVTEFALEDLRAAIDWLEISDD